MRPSNLATIVALWAIVTGLTGCGPGTSKVSESLARPDALQSSNKAVALMRLDPIDVSCKQVDGVLAQRQGETYKPVHGIRVLPRSVQTLVAELRLDPGEYHLVRLSCTRTRVVNHFGDPQGDGTYRTSFGHFTLHPGEVVNLGYIRLKPTGKQAGVFSSAVTVALEATDWPLGELDRYKALRPQHFAHMITRLMSTSTERPSAPTDQAERCARLRDLLAAGKVATLPSDCTSPAPVTRRS